MKLKNVTIVGFRGAPVPVEFPLVQKSLCLLAENGHGKTTIVDGLEFWSSGDIRHYHREGYDLACVVNIDSSSASVTCETSSHPPLTRTLAGSAVSPLQPAGPIAVDAELPPPMPILRHRTMADFMDMTPGEKKTSLLELLGLAQLTDFRKHLRTAAGNAERAATDATRQAKGEADALGIFLGGRDALKLAEELRCEAKLTRLIGSETDLLALEIETSAEPSHPDLPSLVSEVVRALSQIDDDASGPWNEAVRDRETLVGQSVSALVAAGERVLTDWHEDICPLCRQPKDRDELVAELARRAAELREADQRFAVLVEQLDSYAGRVRAAHASLERLLGAAPAEGWADVDKLTAVRDRLGEHAEALARCRAGRTACPESPKLDVPDFATLEEIARRSLTDERGPRALARLVRLQEYVRRLREAERRSEAATAAAAATAAVLEITDNKIRTAIEAAIGRIGTLAANYYGRLVSSPVYSDVTLEYRTGRAGGIEFSLVFDGRHRVSPPQRVMSESQLNALGLALFLAQLKVDPNPWRTIVLDDVVNSFDANHRVGLGRLLAEEFADWQVFLVTHDRVFATLARKILAGWRFSEIAAWTPTGGPVLADGNARERLRTRLAEGRSAGELGGLARVALEQGLSLPLEKLCLEIRYDPLGRYSAHEYLLALRRGLRDRKSSLAGLPVLARMEADSYLVNIGAHDRPADPALTVDDLRRLVDDLTELEEAFVCTACGDAVWSLSRDAGRHHQCRCSALAV